MNRNIKFQSPHRHEVSVIFGKAAVNAYLEGEVRRPVLSDLGGMAAYRFATLEELNAFLLGIELASVQDDALAVTDLP